MSSYLNRYCEAHGEWEEDVDCPSDCPECERLGLTPMQKLQTTVSEQAVEIAALKEERDRWMRCAETADRELAICLKTMQWMEEEIKQLELATPFDT